MKRTLVLALVLAVIFSAPAFANQMIMDNAKSSDYVVKAPAMVARGVINVVSSPLEIVGHTYKGTVDGRPLVGTVQGLGEGLYWFMDRVGRGTWDLLTFWAPRYNGAPPTHDCMK